MQNCPGQQIYGQLATEVQLRLLGNQNTESFLQLMACYLVEHIERRK
jgi:hypothetical protein